MLCRDSLQRESSAPTIRGVARVLLNALLFAGIGLLVGVASRAQTVTRLKNQPPDGAQLTFQLTDGTVMAQGYGDSDWWKLTPDITGSYVNGTWTKLPSLPTGYSPEAFSSAVLADGRLVITGGEYNFGNFTLTNMGAIYDPIANTWTSLAPPKNWSYIGDSPSVVLPNGDFLVGNKLTKQLRVLNPKTLHWSSWSSKGKSDFNAEEGWTLLPNGTVLTADVKNAPNSEIYSTALKEWTTAGSTIVDLHSPSPFGCINYGPNDSLCYYPPGEIGPQILRPDGTVYVTGSYTGTSGPGNSAIYDSLTGKWSCWAGLSERRQCRRLLCGALAQRRRFSRRGFRQIVCLQWHHAHARTADARLAQ